MTPFGCATFLKASLLVLVFSYALAIENGCKPSISEKKAGKVLSRGESHIGVSFVNFREDKFSYLNITILGKSQVDRTPQCSLACLETPKCFSYNLAAYPDINGKLLCELLPSDKYNNSDKFMSDESFHHFSIASPCSGWPCRNHGTCLPLYEENSYKCICKAGFTGLDCENDKIPSNNLSLTRQIKPCDPSPCLNGGNCTTEANGIFTCHCASGWTGETCQEKTQKGLEDSVIIGSNQTYLVQLSEWLKPVSQSNSSWKLCWRGLRDGWVARTFHSLCNGKGPTVTIIKVNQNIFGGYASVSWGELKINRN
ncbi:uncharacterized protein [Montipora foliosa]|uniref:uncharacterized protein n=1 Tax=Montipora foliosa TaxID=591990 RepID=UPI0035F1F3A2